MTATDPALPDLVLLDQETPDGDLTARPSFASDRLVIAVGSGDEETGESIAVALSPADVERLRDYLTDWMEQRNG